MKFSIVVPVKDEVTLLPKTLPSYYSVKPHEVVICMDKPALKEVVTLVKEIAEKHHAEDITRIIEVEKDLEWSYHQAHVRRTGFHKTKHDRILTADIDLVINRNVLKALKLVGKNNIGLVSCTKFFLPNSILDFYRLTGSGILELYIRKLAELYRGRRIPRGRFTGLYALWRPYWLDTETEEGAKRLVKAKEKLQRARLDELQTMINLYDLYGEDVYLHNCMVRKHNVVYLSEVGAFALRNPMGKHPHMQWLKGFHSAIQGRTLLGTIAKTLVQAEPHYLKGYLDGAKIKKNAWQKRSLEFKP